MFSTHQSNRILLLINQYNHTVKNKRDDVMKSRYSLSDYAGYGVSIGSIIGAIGGVILGNPGAGLILGILLGTAVGFLIGRKLLMKDTIKQEEIKHQ